MSKIDIYFMDNSNNTKEEVNIIKPRSYQELLKQIKQKFQQIPKFYEIFIFDNNNIEIKINNEEKYKVINDILFIREIEEDFLGQSIFEINYNKLSEEKQEILDEKYNCILCSIIIKNEKPFLCYKCQKIFHEKCLGDWDKKCRMKNQDLICPNCRNVLKLENWNKKLDYEDNRKDDSNLMNEINELKDIKVIQNELIKKYEKYIEKTIAIFNKLLSEFNMIHNLFKFEINNQLNDIMNLYPLNFQNLDIDNLSNVIIEELNQFKFHISNNGKINLNQKKINNFIDFPNNKKSNNNLILNNIENNYNANNIKNNNAKLNL